MTMKKLTQITFLFFSLLGFQKVYCQTTLQGVISVWNEKGSEPVSLIDDFYYGLCPGDKIQISVSGSANLSPYDEEREKGGFLGMFKKRYTVRIDNWVKAEDANFFFKIKDEEKSIKGSDLKNDNPYEWTIPYNNIGLSLKNTFKIKAFVNMPRSPLRAGQYQIKVIVDSKDRIELLRTYLQSQYGGATVVKFEQIKPFLEAGKLIHRYPDEVVQMVENIFVGNVDIKKQAYEYLLKFSPNNIGVRISLANVYLEELNFSEAQLNAKRSIEEIYEKYNSDENLFKDDEKIKLGKAYSILGSVNELSELGLNENAYTKASYFFHESAKWFKASGMIDNYSASVSKEVRCLQKIGNIKSLETAIKSTQDLIESLKNQR